jgi:hypothetical protein
MTNDATAVIASPMGAQSLKRVSWGSVAAGVLVALMVSLLLAFLGMGIGLATVDPLDESKPIQGLAVGAAIWWIVSTLASLFIGGCVAAHLSGALSRADGMLHGVLTWSAGTLLTLLLLGTAVGGLIGGAAGLVQKGMNMAGQGAAPGASGIAREAASALEQQGIPTNPQQVDPQQLEQRAREAGDKAAKGLSKAALWAFGGLLLSGLAAAWGGRVGTARSVIVPVAHAAT